MTYRGDNHYTVSMDNSSPMEASSWMEDGRVKGFVGERTFQADVAMVDRQLHIFTKVSRISTVLVSPSLCDHT